MKLQDTIIYKLSEQQQDLLLYEYKASCGLPDTMLDLPESRFDFADFFNLDPDTTYILEARGDSMMPDIHSGDMLVFDAAAQPYDGDVVVALINGEDVVVKKFYRNDHDHTVRLVPNNPDYQTITLHEHSGRLQIQGVVRATLRSFRPSRPTRLYRLGNLKSDTPQPQPATAKPKRTAKPVRKLQILHPQPDKMLAKLGSLICGHKGRQVALAVQCAVEEGHMLMPSFAELQQQFGHIGSRQGYQQYINSRKFSDSEKTAVKKFLKEEK